MQTRDWTAEAQPGPFELPRVSLPQAPSASRLGRALVIAAWFLVIYFLLDRGALALMTLWFLDSIGLRSVFMTNFKTGLVLFVIGLLLFTVAVALPAYAHRVSRDMRRRAIAVGVLGGLIAGYVLAGRFRNYLLFANAQRFGEADPVFNLDLSFYTFKLPAMWTTWTFFLVTAVAMVLSSVTFAYLTRSRQGLPEGMNRVIGNLGIIATPFTLGAIGFTGAVLASGIWLSRYGVVIRDNLTSKVDRGAEFLDVTGFFSTVNAITVEMLAVIFMTMGLILTLRAVRHSVRTGHGDWRRRLSAAALLTVFLPGAGLDLAFRSFVALRNETQVAPNEPLIQLPYVKRHIDATNKAFGMDNIEIRRFVPNGPDDPLPDVEEFLDSPTIRNAPLWPGFVASMENELDPQHVERLELLQGNPQIYGPTFDNFLGQQKLRTYYDIEDIDTTRYFIDGEPTLFATANRELPLDRPQPWLTLWGQRSLLFTHGYGLIMTPMSEFTDEGSPAYASYDIPVKTKFPELEQRNPAVYYGESTGPFVAFSNAKGVRELDRPTDEDRAEVEFPPSVKAGVQMDSFLKRLVVGWKTNTFLDIVFSDLLGKESRLHVFRSPVDRLSQIAPFLFYDTDPWAVVGTTPEPGQTGPATDRIYWMVNGLTTAQRYPYAMRGEAGDLSHIRTPYPRPMKYVQYMQDTVKATIDSYTGEVGLYKWKDEPVINTWEKVYPAMFKERSEMPEPLREQVQYPFQYFHTQFDDLYPFYHQLDPLTYFNVEDFWDDGDESLGPLLQKREDEAFGEEVTFSIEPYVWIAEADGSPMPEAKRREQFALSMIFTPEQADNLRSIVTVYQDPEDYGKISILQVPKGHFVMGPQQADAAIDQDDFVGLQFGLWIREGVEILRGHTTPLVVGNELLYVEPIFARSEQQPIPQLKRVAVVFRNRVAIGADLEDAIREVFKGGREFPIQRGPEVGGAPELGGLETDGAP